VRNGLTQSPPGTALVEALVAVVVLTIGALALAATGVANVRLEFSAARRVAASTLVTNRLEQLRLRCGASSGTDSGTGIAAYWRATTSGGTQELFDSMAVVDFLGRPPHVHVALSAAPC